MPDSSLPVFRYKTIEERCVAEGWVDSQGRPLRPANVTLYDCCTRVILPATVGRRCSFVEVFFTLGLMSTIPCCPRTPRTMLFLALMRIAC